MGVEILFVIEGYQQVFSDWNYLHSLFFAQFGLPPALFSVFLFLSSYNFYQVMGNSGPEVRMEVRFPALQSLL